MGGIGISDVPPEQVFVPLAQAGANFVPTSLLEDSIDTIKVTWDLGTTLDTSAHRRAALAAIAKHYEIRKRERALETGPVISAPTLGKLLPGEVVVHQLAATGTVGKVSWELDRDSRGKGFRVSAGGLLFGSPTKAGSLSLTVMACDSWGNRSTCTSNSFALNVDAPKQQDPKEPGRT